MIYAGKIRGKIENRRREFDGILFLNTDEGTLTRLLETGEVDGAQAADHLLGSVEAYMTQRNLGNLVRY